MTLPTSNAAGLHVRYEIAGLILDALPIPWAADAVIVEANVSLPRGAPADKTQFRIKLSTGATAGAEVILQPRKRAPARVFFRIAAPTQTCRAEVFWRDHALGQADVPIMPSADFLQALALRLPSVHVGTDGGQVAACQTIVAGQAHALSASAVLECASLLAPLVHLDLHLSVSHPNQAPIHIRIVFTSGQLRARQTLLTAFLPKLRRLGEYELTWRIGSSDLHSQRLNVISNKEFLRSLRITTTRFLVEKVDGAFDVVRWLPYADGKPVLDGIKCVAPCFYVCSCQPGMAGLASLTLCGAFADGSVHTLGAGKMLVTDGPEPFFSEPRMISTDDLRRIKHFTLQTSAGPLGNLPVVPTPRADFTGEGGFAPLDDFLWSPAAEEQLNERLGKLLDGG